MQRYLKLRLGLVMLLLLGFTTDKAPVRKFDKFAQ